MKTRSGSEQGEVRWPARALQGRGGCQALSRQSALLGGLARCPQPSAVQPRDPEPRLGGEQSGLGRTHGSSPCGKSITACFDLCFGNSK